MASFCKSARKRAEPSASGVRHRVPGPVSYTHLDVYKRQGAVWIDPDFGLYPIAAAAHAGDNVLTLVAQPFTCLLYTSRCV